MGTLSKVTKHFPTPGFLAMSSASVNISNSALRFIELREKNGSVQVYRYNEDLFKKNVVSGGEIKDQNTLISLLKALREKYSLNFINASLPQEQGFVYVTTAPKVSQNEIRESLEFEFEKNVPLSIDQSVFDFDIIGEKENEYQVTVYAFPKKLVDQYVSVLHSAGLTPVSFEPESRALSRAAVSWGDDQTYILVHLKEFLTNISIVSDEKIIFTSTISKGVRELRDPEKSVELKDESFEGREWLKNEVSKTKHYWNDYHAKLSLSEGDGMAHKVIVCGEGLGEEKVSEEVLFQLGSETELANVWKNVMSFDSHIPEIDYEDSFRYGEVVGLALKQFQKDL